MNFNDGQCSSMSAYLGMFMILSILPFLSMLGSVVIGVKVKD